MKGVSQSEAVTAEEGIVTFSMTTSGLVPVHERGGGCGGGGLYVSKVPIATLNHIIKN
jgi:hypothetical protein